MFGNLCDNIEKAFQLLRIDLETNTETPEGNKRRHAIQTAQNTIYYAANQCEERILLALGEEK